MIRSIDEIFFDLSRHNPCSVRTLMARMEELEDGRFDEAIEWVKGQGWVEVDEMPKDLVKAPNGRMFLPDGREFMETQRRFWTLSVEEQQRRVKLDLEAAGGTSRNAEAPPVCTAIIEGALCGGDMTSKPVCPACSLGKMGVAATLTCEICGAITAQMRPK